jgi:NADH pyrophosphatase NudC (nudix superfamily)
MQYCNQCGSENTYSYIDGNNRFHCTHCKIIHYQNPKPTATLICMKKNQILLGKRNRNPAKDKWGLIGGFMELNETIEEAGLRELYEETQLKGEIIDIIGTASHFNTIFGDILLIGLTVQINDWSTLQAGDDISEAHFFDINHLPELAFDSHKELIEIFKKTL